MLLLNLMTKPLPTAIFDHCHKLFGHLCQADPSPRPHSLFSKPPPVIYQRTGDGQAVRAQIIGLPSACRIALKLSVALCCGNGHVLGEGFQLMLMMMACFLQCANLPTPMVVRPRRQYGRTCACCKLYGS